MLLLSVACWDQLLDLPIVVKPPPCGLPGMRWRPDWHLLVLLVCLNPLLRQQYLHNLQPPKPAGTMECSIPTILSNPIDVDSWITRQFLHSRQVAINVGLPQLLFLRLRHKFLFVKGPPFSQSEVLSKKVKTGRTKIKTTRRRHKLARTTGDCRCRKRSKKKAGRSRKEEGGGRRRRRRMVK